jgi:N-carbamoylputrescine amidase
MYLGSSFITSNTGEVLVRADRSTESVILSEFDLDAFRHYRYSWGVFRDRRPELYGILLSKDGVNRSFNA